MSLTVACGVLSLKRLKTLDPGELIGAIRLLMSLTHVWHVALKGVDHRPDSGKKSYVWCFSLLFRGLIGVCLISFNVVSSVSLY